MGVDVSNVQKVTTVPKSFGDLFQELHTQRMDDHRYYHHSRINQSLHLVSATCFVIAYLLLFINPAIAGLLAWLVSMTTRQAGHFFFEPKTYDEVNQATHEHKEEIKVGYNLHRKVILMSLWAISPLVLWMNPTFFGLMTPHANWTAFAHNVGYLWLWLGAAGLLFRTVHLFYLQNVKTGIVWMCKIITDPFHDIKLYWKSPYYLMQGQLIDPMLHVRQHQAQQ
jgi:hypothetical protein